MGSNRRSSCSVDSTLDKSMSVKADAREQLRATLAPVPKPKLARA